MPLNINIPEAPAIRRLAAALATSKLHKRVTEASGLDFGQTVRFYFRRIPWTGRRAVTVDRLLDMSLVTVGQYFVSLDWDGTAITLPSDSPAPEQNYESQVADTLVTPTETVSLEGFFNDYFGG